MSTPELLVDLYLRLSIDKEGKDSLERQEADLREWASREGKTVRTVWRDAGKSGYKRSVKRPDFDSAIAAVKAGEVATLAVWKLDRLSRQGAGQVGTVLDDVDAVGGRVFFLKDSLDSSVPGHRMVIVMVSEQARAESANTSLRVRAKKEVQRRAGQYLGGSAPFGYVVGGDRKLRRNPKTAPLAREVYERLLGGETMLQVCRDWNERGIRTQRNGAHWRSSNLSVILRSPTFAGLVPDHREERAAGYQGADLHPWRHPDTGEHVSLMADGEAPIVTEGERVALLAELDSRLRRYGRGMRAVRQPRSLLGGGLVVCATCQGKCNDFGGAYRCRRREHVGPQCPRPVSVTTTLLDEAVKRAWASRLAALEPGDALLEAVAARWLAKNDPVVVQSHREYSERLATLEAKLAAADHDHYVRSKLDAERYARIAAALEGQMTTVRADIALLPEPEADLGSLLDPELSLPAIMAAPVMEARALLRLAIDKVIVTPADRPGQRFVPHERIRIAWASTR
ncbi:recombinase family protein [Microbacterium sp. NPDC056234]|uniref:recombinase family protein n=1 Tax=Microbacterium sp. NPDC056234 TaxID=3345757 RepID=UPI0035D92A28